MLTIKLIFYYQKWDRKIFFFYKNGREHNKWEQK